MLAAIFGTSIPSETTDWHRVARDCLQSTGCNFGDVMLTGKLLSPNVDFKIENVFLWINPAEKRTRFPRKGTGTGRTI
jgi:hypothetical protein